MGIGRPQAIGLAFAAAMLLVVAPAGARAPEVTETAVVDEAPDSKQVRETYVSIADPLPDSAGPHPKACDSIGYLRFRDRRGPKRSTRADAVITLIPGFLGGAASFDQLARNVVRDSAARGKHVEVWAIDRRANCIEDHHGVDAAARAGDATLAYDYYWGGMKVEGRRFDGFADATEGAFIGTFGLDRTLRDWNTVITTGLPGQRRRERKLICGGHSLGGPLTAAYASWDFDGDPETEGDAGYRQCAGLVGLDTSLEIGGMGSGAGGSAGQFVGTGSPFVDVTPLSPETIQLPPIFGVGAFYQPQETGLNTELPSTPKIDIAQRLLFSRDSAHFVSGTPDIREFTLTNEVTLAGVFDDNSNPVSILRASVGEVTGGSLVDKNFPAPDGTLALPEDTGASYGWRGYSDVGAGSPPELNDAGVPYTSRESEVTDVTQLSRSMFQSPADFTEQYFPTRLLTEVAGAEAAGFEDLRYDGASMKPGLLIQAGDSGDNSAPDEGPRIKGEPPNDLPRSREIILPGYNHLDVVTAARSQNDGRREPSSRALTNFALRVVKDAAEN